MPYDPFTGAALEGSPAARFSLDAPSPSAQAGLEAPRFCTECGRRMVVRINPMGWVATCSRHGVITSE
ncbi:hypothetical protein [Corynebacterium tapiri]|uniref:Biotin synthase auxiliary protein n=1 Tax=Corynebacterium tapiri TaxID=1448266 RepID=A0A5C4U4B3_9CORY|nr:hypothetical protein [Corynebacterium tapiri]TNL96820.1 hypothetical protein FHE74_07305 [Corynebacterium tapiri]